MKDEYTEARDPTNVQEHRSEHRQTEEALRESQRAMKTLLGNLPGLAYRCKNSPAWPFEFVSEGCLNLTGYPPHDFISQERSFESLIHPDDREAVWNQVQAALAQRQPFRLTYRIMTAGGEEKWVWEQGVGIFGEDGEVEALEGFITDITERKRMIEALEAQNAELERFTYTVSHDLKTPLVTIKGFLGLLEEDAVAGNMPRMMADIEQINNAVDRMEALLQTLLHLSRVGRITNPSEIIDLNAIVHEAVGLIAGQIDTNGIEVVIAPDLPPAFGDRIRLLEVWQNVIDNAVKFTGDQPAPRIEIEARKDGDMVLCSVSDNGIGIDPRYQEKIFGLFERLNASVSGTGVGLALVKRIIEWHGGRIWIVSEGLGQGTTVYFTLPSGPQGAD